MGYLETEGIILSRRDVFEDDQEIFVLTPSGGLEARAPHARTSQKSYCGRLEPPNLVEIRLYRARENSDLVVSELSIREVFSDLLQRESMRYHLWPLLSLYRDMFPEAQPPGASFERLIEAFRILKEGFEPPLMVINRLLVLLASRSGIAHSLRRCADCGTSGADSWWLVPDRGLYCRDCLSPEEGFEISGPVIKIYRLFLDDSWSELESREIPTEILKELETMMYRFFHYHFEINLNALKVRQQL